MGVYYNEKNGADTYIPVHEEKYTKLIFDAIDGIRLKEFLREAKREYRTLNHTDICMICDLYGIKDEEDRV